MIRETLLLMGVITAVIGGCSFVEFEPSPYAPRQVDIVYSAQERMTFIFWRIDDSVDPEEVRFELFDPDFKEWRALKLSDAPYPAAPRTCGGETCFQYQLRGQLKWTALSEDSEGAGRGTDPRSRALRSITEDGVIFGALDLRQREADQSFNVNPIAINQNISFDPRRFDLFADLGLTLIRRYEWRLAESSAQRRVEHVASRCALEGTGPWTSLSQTILPEGWTSQAHCLEARPIERADQGVKVVVPMPPSAVLYPLDDAYSPPEQTPLTLFLSLSDLLIRSKQRCALLQREIIQTLREEFQDRVPRGRRLDLGDWFPTTPLDEVSYEDCDQPFDRIYPTSQITDLIKEAILEDGQDDTVVFLLYLNNSDEALPDQTASTMEQLLTELFALPDTRIELLFITGTGLLRSAVNYPSSARGQTIPWQAREVTPFDDLMEEIGALYFPYRTALFYSGMTTIPVPNPPRGVDPDRFKICALSPDTLISVITEGAGTFSVGQRSGIYSYPWGGPTSPELMIDLFEQFRIPKFEYYRERVLMKYELCSQFCDFPFRAKSGIDYLDWSAERRCQREESE